ncbi:MAG: hypothetical protein HZB16_15885 [Armatimonadetes bacterium]|nr:hypothetical protein [Armatimonadota bacterium]
MPGTVACPSWRTPASPAAALALAASALVVGVAFGLAYHLIARVVDLVLLSALFAGIVVGMPVEAAARRLRMANYVVVGLCGLLAGASCSSTKILLDGDRLLRQVRAHPDPAWSATTRAAFDSAMRRPATRLRMAIPVQAETGLEVTRLGVSTAQLQGVGAYVLLALELLLCAAVGGMATRDHFRRHWCPACGEHCHAEVLLELAQASVPDLRSAVESADWRALAPIAWMGEQLQQTERRVNLEHCGQPAHDGYLSLRDRPGRYLQSWLLSPGDLARLRAEIDSWHDDWPAAESAGAEPDGHV